MRARLLIALLLTPFCAHAQWEMQESHTRASLRGIFNVGGGVAWASGTNGTVLHTTDDGKTWQSCAVPPDAAKLDFRGVQAFNADTAIIMSSGPGDQSRLYKTTDGCASWKLVFTNPDKDGFWDAIKFAKQGFTKNDQCFGVLAGDPVEDHFAIFLTFTCGDKWERQIKSSPTVLEGESMFAASNSSLVVDGMKRRSFVTGGPNGSRFIEYSVASDDTWSDSDDDAKVLPGDKPLYFEMRRWSEEIIPLGNKTESSGTFSIASRANNGYFSELVCVGGDYKKPDDSIDTAAFTLDSGKTWQTSTTPPHGYRSAVAYDEKSKAWITVGPNGTDISTDDGKTWRALKPGKTDAPDADRNWNALSLPYVVGPNGRIGKLKADAVK